MKLKKARLGRFVLLGLAGTGLFYCLGGFHFRHALMISYYERLQPNQNNSELSHRGEIRFQTNRDYFYWSRLSVNADESFDFFLEDGTENSKSPFARFKYSRSQFGDKSFYRRKIGIPRGLQPNKQIKVVFEANRLELESRVFLLEFWRPLNFGVISDVLIAGSRAVLALFCLFGMGWILTIWVSRPSHHFQLSRLFPRTSDLYLVFLFIVVLPRLLIASAVYGVTSDMSYCVSYSEFLKHGQNIYQGDVPFSYSPLLLYFFKWFRTLADGTGYSYTFLVRLPLILADCLTTFIILALTKRRELNIKETLKRGLFYAINPVVLCVFIHGQWDSLAILGIIMAYYVLHTYGVGISSAFCTGIMLAFGVGVKTYPIVVFPLFFLAFKQAKYQLALIASFSAALGIFIAGYQHTWDALATMFFYQGSSPRWGWSAIPAFLNNINYVADKMRYPMHLAVPNWLNFMNFKIGPLPVSIWLLLGAGLYLYIAKLRKQDILQAWVIICLTLFAFGQNVANQYFSWLIAPGIILSLNSPNQWKWIKKYSFYGGTIYFLGLLSDRNLLRPLLGFTVDIPWSFSSGILLVCTFALWIFCLRWWISSIREKEIVSFHFGDNLGKSFS